MRADAVLRVSLTRIGNIRDRAPAPIPSVEKGLVRCRNFPGRVDRADIWTAKHVRAVHRPNNHSTGRLILKDQIGPSVHIRIAD